MASEATVQLLTASRWQTSSIIAALSARPLLFWKNGEDLGLDFLFEIEQEVASSSLWKSCDLWAVFSCVPHSHVHEFPLPSPPPAAAPENPW